MKNPTVQNSKTMSSREVAELTDKNHADVLRDIRNMLTDLEIDESRFAGIYLDAYKRKKPCFNLDREHTDCLLTGYSAKARMKVIKRWHELESKQAVQLPDFSNPAIAARAWANEVESKQAAMIERDHAIATKAMINDKRTATLMNKASQDSKRIKKLESQVQDAGTHRSMLAEKLPTYIQVAGKKKSVATILRNISDDMKLPRQKVACERYGSVWAYHVDVIAQFKEMYL